MFGTQSEALECETLEYFEGEHRLTVGGATERVAWDGEGGVTTWSGAIGRGGRIVGLVDADPSDVRLFARTPAGETELVWERNDWWDNDECYDLGTPVSFYYPCGP